jgi:hypothetical protein
LIKVFDLKKKIENIGLARYLETKKKTIFIEYFTQKQVVTHQINTQIF